MSLPPTPWGQLPPTLRVLLVTPYEPTCRWLRQALADDQAAEVVLSEATSLADAMACLREESFDVVLVDHAPDVLDGLSAVDAIRAGTCEEQPILVLGMLPDCEMAALCFESGADAYICLHATTIRAFLWQLARAAERQQLLRENQRLRQSRANGVHIDREEAERLIAQQRALLAGPGPQPERPPADLRPWHAPAQVTEQYRQLLQAFVVLGAGGLAEEIDRWIDAVVEVRWTARQAMSVHVDAVETLVRDLGCRSSRHVINRANLLAMQILMRLSETSPATAADPYA